MSQTKFARFVEIATGSVFEVVWQALIAKRQTFLEYERFHSLYGDAEELSRMLSGWRKSLFAG